MLRTIKFVVGATLIYAFIGFPYAYANFILGIFKSVVFWVPISIMIYITWRILTPKYKRK